MVFRPYLLTLLTHRASWSTLHACVTRLLSDCSATYDPSAILDFLYALTCNPRLWQGRDKFTPKNHKQENVLQLSNNQIQVLISYILQEAIQNNKLEGYKSNEYILKMESRLPLVTACLENKSYRISAAVEHLRVCMVKEEEVMDIIMLDDHDEQEVPTKCKADVAQEFLVLLYMKLPKIIYFLNDGEKKKICRLSYVSGKAY